MRTRALTKSPGHSFSSSLAKIALSRMVALAWSTILSISSNFPLLSTLTLSWLSAATSTVPRASASRTSLSDRADNVKITADGLVRVKVTIVAGAVGESFAWTTLPGSIMRTPMRPSLGAAIDV